MKLLVLLLTAAVACAYANPIAPQEEANIGKRFLFGHHHHHGFLSNVIHDVGKGFKNVGKKIADTGKLVVHDVGHTAEDVGKKIGKIATHVVDNLVKTFKVEGKFVNHFVKKNGKEVGHFFVKEGKEAGHTLVVAGKKIEHLGRDIYEDVRDEVKKEIKNIDYDAVLHQLVKMIDSPLTELACAELSKKAAVAVAGPEIEPAVEAAGPVIHKICGVALHLIEMGAEKGVEKVHLNEKIH